MVDMSSHFWDNMNSFVGKQGINELFYPTKYLKKESKGVWVSQLKRFQTDK